MQNPEIPLVEESLNKEAKFTPQQIAIIKDVQLLQEVAFFHSKKIDVVRYEICDNIPKIKEFTLAEWKF